MSNRYPLFRLLAVAAGLAFAAPVFAGAVLSRPAAAATGQTFGAMAAITAAGRT